MPTAYEKYLANYQEEQQQPSTSTVVAQTQDAFQLDSEDKTLDQFANDETFMDNLRTYAMDRYGDDGRSQQEEGESNKEYVEKFLTHIRQLDNTMDLTAQVDWQRSASVEQRENFGKIYKELDDKLPTIWEKGGGSVGKGLLDYFMIWVGDPLNLVSLGVGKIIGRAGVEAVKKSFIEGGKEAAKKTARKYSRREGYGAAGTEGLTEAGQDVLTQEIEQAAIPDEEQETDFLRLGIAGTLGSVVGGGLAGLGANLGYRSNIKRLQKEADAGTLTPSGDQVLRTSALDPDQPELTYKYSEERGKELLKDVEKLETSDAIRFTPEGVTVDDRLTEPGMATPVMQQMAKFAYDLVKLSQEEGVDLGFDFTKDQKASKWIEEIIAKAGMEEIDSDVLQKALRRNGLTEGDILDMAGATYTQVGKTLQTASPIGKLVKKIKELDPAAVKQLDAFAEGTDVKIPSAFNALYEVALRLDRERRALMTSQLSTTARNAATAVTVLGMGTLMKFMDSTLYHAGLGIQQALKGEASVSGFTKGLNTIVQDTFGLLAYLDNPLRAKELSNTMLKHNPRIARIIDRTMTEMGSEDAQRLSKFTRLMSFANIAQDGFLRRAVFADSVERQLRRTGEDIDKIIKSKKNIPVKVLRRAADDALEFTFSRMPKQGGEKVGDTLGYHFVRMTEALPFMPVGTGVHPFARFMVNAMQFQYEYSPLNVLNGVERLFRYNQKRGLKDINEGLKGAKDANDAASLLASGRKKIAQSTVGTAALIAAVQYRTENQDLKWYHIGTDEGRTVDMRPFFPIAPYLIVADIIVKVREGNAGALSSKDIYQGLTGSMSRTAREGVILDGFFNALESDGPIGTDIGAVKISEALGKWLGEIGGQFLTSAGLIEKITKQVSPEASIARDSNIIEGEGALERGGQAAWNKFIKRVPFLQETLPRAESPTEDINPRSQSSILDALGGIKIEQLESPATRALRTILGKEQYQIVTPTGDKTADRYVKKYMGPLVNKYISRVIKNEKYLKATKVRKRSILNAYLTKLRSIAKDLGEAQSIKDADGRYTPFDRAKWLKIKPLQRDEANEYYMVNYGKTVTEMQQEQPEEPHFRRGVAIGRALSK